MPLAYLVHLHVFCDITDSNSAPSHPSHASHPSLQQALHEAHGEEVPGHVQHQSPVSEARPVAQDLRGDARPAFSQGNAEELTDAGDPTEEAFLEVVQWLREGEEKLGS